jgi:hypothetical protein
MLNLRQANRALESSRYSGHDTTHRSTIRFNASIIVGNLGESLDFGQDDNWENEVAENAPASSSDSSIPADARSIEHASTDTGVSENNNLDFSNELYNVGLTYDVFRKLTQSNFCDSSPPARYPSIFYVCHRSF